VVGRVGGWTGVAGRGGDEQAGVVGVEEGELAEQIASDGL
jgi:hypothetical protein